MSQPESHLPGLPAGLNRGTFSRFAEPHRQELKLHCYRMLGSLQDAEDAVQETFVSAWRALDAYQGRALFKTWLYRIATNACLNALAARARRNRILPQHLGEPARELPRGEPDADVPWLEPYPDSELAGVADASAGHERRYEMREAVRLAFMAAIQQLPPRQRAALILADVLGWPAVQIAALLGGSVASINSIVQRARGATAGRRAPEPLAQGSGEDQQDLLERYVLAWERADLDALVSLLSSEATLAMPPWRQWYRGRAAIRWLFENVWKSYSGFRLLPLRANSQPGFALYARTPASAGWHAHSIQVLSTADGGVVALTMFMKPLFAAIRPAFGLAPQLTD